VQEDIDELRMLVENQGVSRVAKDKKLAERHEAEFKVFSQWRDDSLIQFLISELEVTRKIFI
jgi:hypothetical protein